MRKGWFLALGALLAVSCGCAERGELVLAERGKPAEYAIVVPSEPTPVLRYAAEEMRDWTEKLTGVRLPIETNTTPAKAIYVGGATEDGLETDGFRVRVEGRSVRILGSSGKRGVLYGVYELLEAYGGIGWFSSWRTVVPKADRFAIPAALDDRQTPAFAWREHFSYDANENYAFAARIRKNNASWGDGFPVKLGGGYRHPCRKLRGHSFYTLIPPERYFGVHPEWFSEVKGTRLAKGGQLCLTNPEMTRTAISNLLALVRAEPGCDIVAVAHNDCFNFCTCPNCKAVDEEEDSPAGTELRFVNACAEALEREFPDMIVKFSAYQYTRVPPKVTKPRRNVLVDFAPIETDYSSPIAGSVDKETAEIRENIRDWGRIASEQGLYVFDYVAYFYHYLMPYPNIRSLQPNIRFYRDNRTRFLVEEDDHCGNHGEFTELKAWLCSKWMWNPELDYETLLDRFMKGYYGAAAPFVRRYLDELHDRNANQGCRLGCFMSQTACKYVDDAFIDRALDLWDRAAEAVKDDPECAYNVRMGRMSVLYAALQRQGLRICVRSTEFPTPRIRALAQDMLDSIEIAKKNGRSVTFAEGGYRPNGKDEKLLARWRRLADPKLATPPRNRAAVEIEDIFDVWSGFHVKLENDPGASGGKAYRMPNNFSGDWIISMPMSVFGYDPGARYRYRLRVRVERKPGAPDGNLITSGPGAGDAVTRLASEASDRYAWLEFATFTPNPKQTLFIAPGRFDKKKTYSNPAYESLWIDQIEIEKVAECGL